MDSSAIGWLAALAFLSVPVAALLLVEFASRGRLVRCPETGGIGMVELEPFPARGAQAKAPCVRRCDLWSQRQGCLQGCLDRYAAPAPRYGVDLKALRPFPGS